MKHNARGRIVVPRDAFSQFWSWWSAQRERFDEAIDRGDGHDENILEEMSLEVGKLHPDLAWEMAPGRCARNALCLSCEGDARLRQITEQWIRFAPTADDAWEYHPHRIPILDLDVLSLFLNDIEISYADVRIDMDHDVARERIDVTVCHPAFSQLSDGGQFAAFLLLDGALGEDGTERWIGTIRWAHNLPESGITLHELKAAVDELSQEATGKFYVTGECDPDEDGMPLVVMANLAVKRWDHPYHDTFGTITIQAEQVGQRGMPTSSENRVLNAVEQGLLAALQEHAVFVAHETGRGQRTVHIYVVGDGPAPAAVEAATAGSPRELAVEWVYDPDWQRADRW